MKARFSAIPFVVYPVHDMAVARVFYQDVLHLEEVGNWDNQWVEFGIPGYAGPVLALSTLMDACEPGAKGAAAALETEHFEEMLAHLRACGVKLVFGPIDSGVCHFARFEDPEGNHLVLHKKHG